jgi:protein O-GlcNAc transferase
MSAGRAAELANVRDRNAIMKSATTALLQQAVLLHRQGALAEAAQRYLEVLRGDPGNADVLHSLAQIACQEGRLDDGVDLARQALAVDPRRGRSHNLLGMALARLGRSNDALASFDAAIACAPELADAYGNRGDLLAELGRQTEAIESYDRALKLTPNSIETWCNRGAVLHDLGRHIEALASYDRVIALKPDFAEVHCSRGQTLVLLGRAEDALTSFGAALAIAPDYVLALVSKGDTLRRLARHEEALVSYARALTVKPGHVDTLIGQGAALIELARLDAALASFDAALVLEPSNANAHNNRGFVLNALNRRDEALASYECALRIDPNHVEALNNRGVVLSDLALHDAAIASFDRALAAAPEHTGALCNRAKALGTLRRYDEALASADRALAVEPRNADALFTRGNMLLKLERDTQAIAAFEQVLVLEPQHPHAVAVLANAYLTNCDWLNTARMAQELKRCIDDGRSVVAPFVLFGFPLDTADLLACTRHYVAREIPQVTPIAVERRERPSDRIRLAYLSGDFGRHPLSYLIVELLERHDRTRFEVIGVSCGPDDGSDIRARVVRSFDRWHDVAALGDRDVVKLLREESADIVIDLSGYTDKGRPGILAYRPAPIQVNYLGFLGSMGAEFIDYVIGDETVLPQEQQPFYAERIVRLPHCFQVNDSTRPISARTPTRREAGLPEQGFVFCCFNGNYKITASVFDIWMRLLHAVDGSVLWLFRSNSRAVVNLQREAAARGIDPSRLIFAAKTSPPEHLARHRIADLFLDTLPINAGATASDALWAGLPIVTRLGNAFPGRISASLLRAIGLPELVTNSAEDYEALALRLAREPELFDAVRRKVSDNRLTSPLFDTDRFRIHIEAAYTTMVESHRRGERPRSFSVEPMTE